MTQLRVIQPEALRPDPRFAATSAPVSFGTGFYSEEHDGVEPFRWMGESASLTFDASQAARFLEYWASSEFHDLSQRLEIRAGALRLEDAPLVHGWSPRSLEVPAGVNRLDLRASRLFPQEYYPADRRALALRVRGLRLHADRDRHAAVRCQQENAALNAKELLDGRTVLESTPPSLGIDLHGSCNVKPPCVYCEWDNSKSLEQDHVDTPFTRETLRDWGAFFDNAVGLYNCSIGEPFMMRQIDELLDTFGDTGKVLEMTTNGQILTDRNIQKVVGRPIDLYVSLDAATPLTYSRLRNDTFDKLLRNIRRLVDAKGGPGRLPRVHAVFMPMRCNVHELDAVVRLSVELCVDRLVLRPLNYSPTIDLSADRGGYHFDYQHELLPFDELVAVSARAARLARDAGLPLADQMDFGSAVGIESQEARARDAAGERIAPRGAPGPTTEPAAAALAQARPEDVENAAGPQRPPTGPPPPIGSERLPPCSEPWKSLFILRRGVSACCYGGRIAPMDEYRHTWNSAEMQEIRATLLEGRLPGYCLRSRSCPIVRRADESGSLPRSQRTLLQARSAWAAVDRRLWGLPKRMLRRIRRGLLRVPSDRQVR